MSNQADNVTVKLHFEQDRDTSYLNRYAGIFLIGEDEHGEDTEIEIGQSFLTIYNLRFYENDSTWLLEADSKSGNAQHMVSELISYIKYLDEEYLNHCIENDIKIDLDNISPTKIMTIDYMSIQKEYRKHGYGTEALNMLKKYCQLLDIDIIALSPVPFEEDLFNISIDRRKELMDELSIFYSINDFSFYQSSNDIIDFIMIFEVS